MRRKIYFLASILLVGSLSAAATVPALAQGGCGTSELSVSAEDGSTHCIPYTISGASIAGSSLDVSSKALTVSIRPDGGDGELKLNIPRYILDAKVRDADTFFSVLVNGEEFRFVDEEEATADTRTLMIFLPPGAEDIQVIGTTVIPEFGSISMMILTIAIISAIGFFARTRPTLK